MIFFLVWVFSFFGTIFIREHKNLSWGYVVCACFFGPLAFIAAVIAKPQPENSKTTLAHLKEELRHMQQSISFLEQRVQRLEQGGDVSEPMETPPLQEEPSEVVSHHYEDIKTVQQKALNKEKNFELNLGKYWLNRIGIALFVGGMALFISLAFQYFDAAAKIMLGYAVALMLFVLGNRLEAQEKYRKVAWGILGGSWGLIYFTTYAMHYVEAVRIIDHPVLAFLLLSIVSLVSVIYNLKYNSWITTGLTFALAFLTAGLGHIDLTSICYFALLCMFLVYVACRRQWSELIFFGVMFAYTTYAFWDNTESLTMLSLWSLTWVVFLAAPFFMHIENDRDQKYLLATKVVNILLFVLFAVGEVEVLSNHWDLDIHWRFAFLTALAGLYLILPIAYKLLHRTSFIVASVAIAFFLFGTAIFIRMPAYQVTYYWLLEMVLLFVLGVYYRERVYRILGALLSLIIMIHLLLSDLYMSQTYLIFGHHISHVTILFSFASLCFYVMGAVANKVNQHDGVPDQENRVYFWAYPMFASWLMFILLYEQVPERWLSLSWGLLGLGTFIAGFILENKIFRYCALALLAASCLRVVFVDMSEVNTIYKILAFMGLGVILVVLSLIYSKFFEQDNQS